MPQNAYNPGAEYANSDFDVRQRFTLSLTYAIPGKKGYAQALEGWELNSIITLQTPQYWGRWMRERTLPASVRCPSALPRTARSAGISMATRTISNRDRQEFRNSPERQPSRSDQQCGLQCESSGAGWRISRRATGRWHLFGCYAKGNSIMIPPALGTIRQHGPQHLSRIPVSGTWISRWRRTGILASASAPSSGPSSSTFSTIPTWPILTAARMVSASMIHRSAASVAVAPLRTLPPPTRSLVRGAAALGSTRAEAYFLMRADFAKSGPELLRPHLFFKLERNRSRVDTVQRIIINPLD